MGISDHPGADGPLHGFGLPATDHLLLRSAPPAEALAWASAAVGAGARVVAARALEGGTSSAVHALDVEDRTGRRQALVLRRYVRAEWLAEEPDVPQREAAALQVLRRSAVSVPTLVAVDPSGEASGGVPALLMTRLPGRIDWSPPDLASYLRRLAELLPPIHAVTVPRGTPLPAYQPYPLGLTRPPRWATQLRVWERAIQLHGGPPPALGPGGAVFIHRDYHPGNVLWQDGRVSGVVDWPCASIGAPEADVGHCRVNLHSRFGAEAADRFLALYQAVSGRREYHPYWDIVAAIGGMDEGYDEVADLADERFVAAAVGRL